MEELVKFADPKIITVNGVQYATKELRVIAPYAYPQLAFASLTPFLEYCISDIDKPYKENAFIYVRAYNKVELITQATDSEVKGRVDRRILAKAELDDEHVNLCFTDLQVETAIVLLQTKFTESGDRDGVIALVSNIAHDESTAKTDDGLSQTVVVKNAITLGKQKVEVKNPVTLYPNRTFPEIEQPAHKYILRIQKNARTTDVEINLFPVSDSMWRINTSENIKKFLVKILNGAYPVV